MSRVARCQRPVAQTNKLWAAICGVYDMLCLTFNHQSMICISEFPTKLAHKLWLLRRAFALMTAHSLKCTSVTLLRRVCFEPIVGVVSCLLPTGAK